MWDANGVELVEGSRVRRGIRSKRERNVRKGYFDVGTVQVAFAGSMWKGKTNDEGQQVEYVAIGDFAYVAWDDGRHSTVKAVNLLVVSAEDHPEPRV